MKKNVLYVLTILFAFGSCVSKIDDFETVEESFNSDIFLAKWGVIYQNVCPSVTDAFIQPNRWNPSLWITISDKTIRSMSTCGLLETMIENPLKLSLSPGSNLFSPGITNFNNELRTNKAAVAFFKRRDFYPILASKYLSVINHEDMSIAHVQFEGILSSDLCMSALNKRQMIQLMVMALERTKYALDTDTPRHFMIMISIMKTWKYHPFVKDIEPRLFETAGGYTLLEPDGSMPYLYVTNLSIHHRELIIKYAKQFLNEI